MLTKTLKNPTEASVRAALKTIMDPELFVSIVDLGLVYAIVIDGGKVHITMTLTTIGCPLFQTIENDIREKLLALPGVTDIDIELTFNPPWDPSRISPEAKAELGME